MHPAIRRPGSATMARTWVVATVAYGAARVLFVRSFLADYGVNVAVFATIELSSSLLLGWASGNLLRRIRRADWRGSAPSLVLTIVGYVASDAYLLAAAGRYPATLRTIVIVVAIASLATGAAVVRRAVTSLP